MRLLLALGAAFATGWGLTAAAWPHRGDGRADRLARAALALGLGLGLSSLAFFVGSAAWHPSVAAALAPDLALLAASLVLWHRACARRRAPAAGAPDGAGGWEVDRLLAVALAIVTAGAVAAFALKTYRAPHGDWDAWAIWNLRARFLHRAGAGWRDAFSPALGWSHPDYPLLVPGAVARLWTYAGREPVAAPIAVAAALTAATAGLLGAAVWLLRGRRPALVAALLLVGTPGFALHGAAQYAEVAVAGMLLAALVLVCLHDRHPGALGPALLGGLAAGLLSWAKNEGTLLLLALVAARLGALLPGHGPRAAVRRLAPFLAGTAPAVLALCYFRLWLAPPSELVPPLDLGVIGARVGDPARWLLIGRALAGEVVGFGGWAVSVIVLLAAYAGLVGFRRVPADRDGIVTAAGTLGLSGLGFGAVYLLTPYDLGWHLGTSLWRLLYELWPSVVLLVALVTARPAPEGSGPGTDPGSPAAR